MRDKVDKAAQGRPNSAVGVLVIGIHRSPPSLQKPGVGNLNTFILKLRLVPTPHCEVVYIRLNHPRQSIEIPFSRVHVHVLPVIVWARSSRRLI
jgi:hypothetical protein